MEKLLKDTNTMVLGSAVAAFTEVRGHFLDGGALWNQTVSSTASLHARKRASSASLLLLVRSFRKTLY